MASLMSPPIEPVNFLSPKRARLSLKHRVGRPPSKPKFEVDTVENRDEKMIIDREQDENISPNCNIPEAMSSPYISDNIINKNYKISALGLPNCGNTCFINSIVQVLRYTPNFVDILHSLVASQKQLIQIPSDTSDVKPDDFFHKLHMVYVAMKKQEEFLHKDTEENYTSTLLDHVQSFVASLGEISSLFKEGEQHDAHEFLLTVVSHFDMVSMKVKQTAELYCKNAQDLIKSSPSPSKDKRKLTKRCRLFSAFIESGLLQKTSSLELGFEGNMQHTVKCLECEKRSERLESFTNLEVSIAKEFITEETVDLCQCLLQRTVLSGDNKYFCEECFHSTEAHLFSEIISLPPVLVLHCSWLRQSSFPSQIEKDSTKIDIPLTIKASENLNIFLNAADETYCLYAVVLHIGTSAENGHYVSFIKAMPENSEMLDYSLFKSVKQNCDDTRNCCVKENIFNAESNCSTNNWLFFDDEEVLCLSLSDTSIFPYYKFMTTSASPCIIFYYKK